MAKKSFTKNVDDFESFYSSFFEKLEKVYAVYTQQEVADHLGVSKSTVNDWLQGTTRPGKTMLRESYRKLRVLENKHLQLNQSL